MRRKLVFILLAMIIAVATLSYAVEPTETELDAFNAALELHDRSNKPYPENDPSIPPDPSIPTPEELKAQAIAAFRNFITTYPNCTLCATAQLYIGKCYRELNDSVNAKAEFQKVVANYPTSTLVDDARYLVAFIDYEGGNYQVALAGFNGLITDYEGNANENLTHQVPFAYFMVGECYRGMNDMVSARAKWNELIVKYPKHSYAGLAKKRLQ